MDERSRAGGPGAFAVLVAAAEAIERRQRQDLDEAVSAVSQESLLRVAARHRCLGYLRRGLLELGASGGRALSVVKALREYASKAAIQAYAGRVQLDQLIRALDAGAVPFALLKGSARLFRGDKEAERNTMYDMDVLVPAQDAHRAVSVLQTLGYRSRLGTLRVSRFWEHHHHLAPLEPAGLGLPVELHLQLAPPGAVSIATDWDACAPYFERIVKGDVEATCFDALGTALHLAIHGIGMRRFHDIVMLSKMLREQPGLQTRLSAALASERLQPIALEAVVALAARVAGIPFRSTPQVARYLMWIACREELAPYVRDRSQFADAWYGNGGKFSAPAIRRALPIEEVVGQHAIARAALFPLRLVGRMATGAYAIVASSKQPVTMP